MFTDFLNNPIQNLHTSRGEWRMGNGEAAFATGEPVRPGTGASPRGISFPHSFRPAGAATEEPGATPQGSGAAVGFPPISPRRGA